MAWRGVVWYGMYELCTHSHLRHLHIHTYLIITRVDGRTCTCVCVLAYAHGRVRARALLSAGTQHVLAAPAAPLLRASPAPRGLPLVQFPFDASPHGLLRGDRFSLSACRKDPEARFPPR